MHVAMEYVKQLPEREAMLLKHYTCEIDPDDWAETPLLVSYEVINFLLKRKYLSSESIGYVPALLEERALSTYDIQKQIDNARHLHCILQQFPPTPVTTTVYRGFLAKDAYFKKSASLLPGEELMVPYFLSTSTEKETALRFTNRDGGPKCIWQVIIPQGVPLAFLEGGEKEVLVNMGAVLKCLQNNLETSQVILQLIGFSKAVETRAFWKSLHVYARQ